MGQWKKPPGRTRNGKQYDDELARVHWREFERIMARWYTLQGYEVEERGTQSGRSMTDGGVDLVLRGRGEKVLVQCKHEKVLQVPYNAAMQLRGLIHAEEADRAILVTTGEFTPEALRKAAKAGQLELIDGDAVRKMLGPELARLRDAAWVTPVAAAPVEMSRLPVLSRIDHGFDAPEPARRVVSRPMSSKLTVFALLAFVVAIAVVAAMGVRRWDLSSPSPPVAIEPPAIKPVAAAPMSPPAEKSAAEPKPSRHLAATTKPKTKSVAREPAIETPPAPTQVIHKSADMSDAEFEAWKLRKARRDAAQPTAADEPQPTGPATPARTMQTILRTNRQ